jgi:hypothetical protein
MQIFNLQYLFKLPLKAIVASTKTNRFDNTLSNLFHSKPTRIKAVYPRCPFLPCLDYIPAT